MFSNIYLITNNVNNKKYVGQSTDIKKRWNEHIHNAKRKEDTTIYLYNAMKKYNIDNFIFEIIEEGIPLDEVNKREEYWISELNTLRPNGYNLTLGGEGTKGYIMSDKTKNLISNKAIERFNLMTEEEKNELKNRLPKNSYDLIKMNEGAKKWREDAPKEVIEDSYKRAVQSKKEKGYDFYNFSFGKMSDDEKTEMYNKVSKNNPKSKSIYMLNEDNVILKEFHSIREASRYLNKEFGVSINSKNYLVRILDSDKLAYGFKWKRK